MTESIRDLWATDTEHQPSLSSAELRRRSARLDARVRRRDLIEYAASVFVILGFSAAMLLMPAWPLKLACLAVIIGTVVVVINLRRRSPPPDAAMLGRDALGYYRARLTQQSAALHSIWRWYLGPLIPGMAMFYAAVWWMTAQQMGWLAASVGVAPQLIVPAAIFIVIGRMNHRAARALDREIEALDAIDANPHHDEEEETR